MDVLIKTLRADPGASMINLEGRRVQEISNPFLRRLYSFSHLRILNLRSNNLNSLPRDLSGLRHLSTLDLANNPIKSAASILPGLKSLPKLRDLFVDLSEGEMGVLLANLPTLEVINGFSTTMEGDEEEEKTVANRKGNSKSDHVSITMTQEDLETVASLFADTQTMFNDDATPAGAGVSPRASARFDSHVRDVMNGLSGVLASTKEETARQAHIIMAKHALFDICFDDATRAAHIVDPRLSAVLSGLREQHGRLFRALPALLGDAQAQHKEAMAGAEARLSQMQSERTQLLEAAEVLGKEAEERAAELAAAHTRLRQQQQDQALEVQRVQEENEDLQQRLAAAAAAAAATVAEQHAETKGKAQIQSRRRGGGGGGVSRGGV